MDEYDRVLDKREQDKAKPGFAGMPRKSWLCVETVWDDTKQAVASHRISNIPGGRAHCYFTGTRNHLPRCGYYELRFQYA